jgi:2,4-dienoyl-CoA reductase-like NADH-dependent reductase (Old Yellow Enzyme family)
MLIDRKTSNPAATRLKPMPSDAPFAGSVSSPTACRRSLRAAARISSANRQSANATARESTSGPKRAGIKTGPMTTETGAFVANEDTLRTSNYVINRLNEYRLSHLLLMEQMANLTNTPLASVGGNRGFRHFRRRYYGTLIANVGFDPASINEIIDGGLADLVAFGRAFIANPDLPARFAANAPLNELYPDTIYDGGAAGYTDHTALYPTSIETEL